MYNIDFFLGSNYVLKIAQLQALLCLAVIFPAKQYVDNILFQFIETGERVILDPYFLRFFIK